MSAVYETDKLLGEYLLFHYGSAEETLPPPLTWPAGMCEALDFAIRTPRRFGQDEVARGLDIGCAVGRSAWEMARHCDEVIGIDFSHAFIKAAETIRSKGELAYVRVEEAARCTPLIARRPADIDPSRIVFQQGDAMDLSDSLGRFDRVHAANLICRLPEPQRFLQRLPSLLKPGGELVLATPCTWLEEFTAPQWWPQGETLDWLKDSLSGDFELVSTCDEPFLIRETARKFQWTRSLVSVWRRH
jgi:putative 4-mercaptohistidine N1-methyltranferase